MEKTIDERLFDRLTKDIPVKYTIPNGDTGEVMTKDISMDGMRLQLPERLFRQDVITQGSRLDIELYMSHRHRATTICGKIVWQKKNTYTSNYDIGIKFVQADPFDIEDIIQSFSE